MKKLISLITVFFMAVSAIAQKSVAVKYTSSNRASDSGDIVTEKMSLIANPTQSLYFNEMSLYVDSCMSTPEGAAKLKDVQEKGLRVEHPDGSITYDGWKYGFVPMKAIDIYVEKNASKEVIKVYDRKAGEMMLYEEPFEEMTWKIISDSVKTILGYECMMAETNYHGRTWKAWFTTEIPVQDGPWKLRGLPGIILEANGGNDFTILATEVGKTSQPVPPVYSTDKYEKGLRKKILADHEYYINNLESIMAAQGIKLNGDGSPANLPKYDRPRQAWETDY